MRRYPHIFSDIHGNSIAADAVLADIQTQGGVDEYWVLGDLVAIGHDPIGVMERLAKLPNAHFVRGNTDRYVISDQIYQEWIERAKKDLNQLPRTIEEIRSINWTRGAISVAGLVRLVGGVAVRSALRVAGRHARVVRSCLPGTDEGRGMNPQMTDDELWELFKECEADLVFVGHTHQAQDRS